MFVYNSSNRCHRQSCYCIIEADYGPTHACLRNKNKSVPSSGTLAAFISLTAGTTVCSRTYAARQAFQLSLLPWLCTRAIVVVTSGVSSPSHHSNLCPTPAGATPCISITMSNNIMFIVATFTSISLLSSRETFHVALCILITDHLWFGTDESNIWLIDVYFF